MKIVRSKGESYSQNNESIGVKKNSLERGIILKNGEEEKRGAETGGGIVLPKHLVAYIKNDPQLLIRQTISILDKCIKKPKSLRHFNEDAYKYRALVGEQLWTKLCDCFSEIRLDKNIIANLKKIWISKVHPYAEHETNIEKFYKDKNLEIIKEAKNQRQIGKKFRDQNNFEKFKGKFFSLFFGQDPNPDFKAVAKKIHDHLITQELNTKGKAKKIGNEPSGKGQIEARAHSIQHSTHDPRNEHTEDSKKWGVKNWDDATFWTYCYNWTTKQKSIAQIIYEEILRLAKERSDEKSPIFPSDIAPLIYDHFGKFLKYEKYKDLEQYKKERLWNLHNQIRKFYKKRINSMRFKIAVKKYQFNPSDKTAKAELGHLLPKKRIELFDALNACDHNMWMSENVRLGKMIAHSCDKLYYDAQSVKSGGEEPDYDKIFQDNMDFFATSAGQIEIKRNESFVRFWREAIGQSFHILQHIFGTTNETDFDIIGRDKALQICKALKEKKQKKFNNFLSLIWGNRIYPDINAKSRSGLLKLEDEAEAREISWALLTITRTIRNKVNHYMIKPQLMNMINGGLVIISDNIHERGFENGRDGNIISKKAAQIFEDILAFDRNLQKQMIMQNLQANFAFTFCDEAQLTGLYEELCKNEALDFISPNFRATLARAQNLKGTASADFPSPLQNIADIQLKNINNSTDANRCKIGLLRMLYNSGFQSWLQNGCGEENFPQLVGNVITAIKARKEEIFKAENLIHHDDGHFLDGIKAESIHDLPAILNMLLARGTRNSGNDSKYQADKATQRNLSQANNSFAQEIIAHLFEKYIEKYEFTWIWAIDAPLENPITPDDFKAKNAKTSPTAKQDQPNTGEQENQQWQALFYAWLYLLPNDMVARMRHQMIKSRILEKEQKSQNTPPHHTYGDDLKAIEQLMALYVAVQEAGFDGSEHVGNIPEKLLADIFEDESQFDDILNADKHMDDSGQNLNISGARRGLRLMSLHNHDNMLGSIFRKHYITKDEVDAVLDSRQQGGMDAIYQEKNQLHRDIAAAFDEWEKIIGKESKDRYRQKIQQLTPKYHAALTQCTLHDVQMRGAHMIDHVELHQLSVRLLSRLLDFTMIWERDRIYILLAMLYRQQQADGKTLSFTVAGKKLILQWPDGDNDTKEMKLWNENKAYTLLIESEFDEFRNLLDESHSEIFNKHFYQPDNAAIFNRKDERRIWPKDNDYRSNNYRKGKKKIRNDFAHFNVIRNNVSFSYLVNAVRSLFSYDKKLKNAVSKAIIDILADDGVVLQWHLVEDRLKKPQIKPALLNHLDFLRGKAFEKDGTFPIAIPRRSLRYCSMVMGLFTQESGGMRNRYKVAGKVRAKGSLVWPKYICDNENIPEDIRQQEYDKLPHDRI